MKNYFNKLCYIIINAFHLKAAPAEQDNYDLLHYDDFHNLDYWAVMHPETTSITKNNGLVLKLHKVSKNSYIYPTIISRGVITGGSVIIQATLSTSEKAVHSFMLRSEEKHFGFIIVNGLITIKAIQDVARLKLYRPTAEHTFEIDVNPENDTIFWRVDGVTVYQTRYTSFEQKRLVIAMPTITPAIQIKELPVSFNIKSVEFLSDDFNKINRLYEG